ncbi:hypothetical protein XPA_009207 [Xanthoria parietina]
MIASVETLIHPSQALGVHGQEKVQSTRLFLSPIISYNGWPVIDSSGIGITLQGYDQVIALSQANINENLRQYYSSLDAKDELGRFNASAKTDSIDAQGLPPTVELVDKDKADGALYIIHSGEGSYSTVVEDTKGGEGNDVGNESSFEKLTIYVHACPQQNSGKGCETSATPRQLLHAAAHQQPISNCGDINRIVQLDPGRSRFPISDKAKDKDNIDATELES